MACVITLPLNGVTTRQIDCPLMVVAVNGTVLGVVPRVVVMLGRLTVVGGVPGETPGESTLKQKSLTVRPVSTPPPNWKPELSRALTLTATKSFWYVTLPKVEACDTTLLTWPNLFGLTS